MANGNGTREWLYRNGPSPATIGAALVFIIGWVFAAGVFWHQLNSHMTEFEEAQSRNDRAHYFLLQRVVLGDATGPVPPDLLNGLAQGDSN